MIDVDLTNAFKNARPQQNLLALLCLLAWIIYQVGYDIQTSGGVPVIEGFVVWFLMLANFAKRGSRFEEASADRKKNDDIDSESEFFQNPTKTQKPKKEQLQSSLLKQSAQVLPYMLIIASIKTVSLFDLKDLTEFPHKDVLAQNASIHRFLSLLGALGIALVENFYLNRKYKLTPSLLSSFVGNALTLALAGNNELNMRLKEAFEGEGQRVRFLGVEAAWEVAEGWHVAATWTINAVCVLGVALVVLLY